MELDSVIEWSRIVEAGLADKYITVYKARGDVRIRSLYCHLGGQWVRECSVLILRGLEAKNKELQQAGQCGPLCMDLDKFLLGVNQPPAVTGSIN